MKKQTQYHTSGHDGFSIKNSRAEKITSSQYQNVSEKDKLLYVRFSGQDEVYYILLNPQQP